MDSSYGTSIQTFRDLFIADVSGRDVPHGKPAPDLFLAAAREVQVRPDQCIVVEDAISGIAAAKAGGMKAQDAALKSPECFDSDAEELLSWFNTEVGNRGKRELLASRG